MFLDSKHLSWTRLGLWDFCRFAASHRRALSATLMAGLAGFGVAAFGIAPLAPDAATLPHRLINEPLRVAALDSQLESLAVGQLDLSRSDLTRANDTSDSLLRRLGVTDAAALAFARSDATARLLVLGRAGKMVSAQVGSDGRLHSLVARFPVDDGAADKSLPARFNRLTLKPAGEGRWLSWLETVPLVATPRLASGSIRSTLFAATDEAGLPDAIASQMVEMFSTEIDFHRELRKGDHFSLVYEALSADGEPINWNQGAGRVLAAEFVNNGKAHHAVWFGEGKGEYYDFSGQSKRRAFLASPLAFSRVTSGFAMRFHPILQTWKAHLGVDYGAPIGTPVRVVGDGVVSFAGRQNGYGNVVQVQHSDDRMTVYAHLSRIDVRQGQHVEQGQTIAATGATGWATGPHLHFEFRVHGQHQDPLVIARTAETLALDASQRQRFAALSNRLQGELDVAETLVGRPGRVE